MTEARHRNRLQKSVRNYTSRYPDLGSPEATDEDRDSDDHESAGSASGPVDSLKACGGWIWELFLKTCRRNWAWELLACFLSLIFLLAVVITLSVHNEHPLPDWRFGITVNALVSVFSIFYKGTLMVPVVSCIGQLQWHWFLQPRPLKDLASYDSASRGVVGSLHFLKAFRGKLGKLASIGAAITILAFASDPFFQQLIQHHNCMEVAFKQNASAASLARTNVYFSNSPTLPNLPMQAAVSNALLRSYSQPQGVCTTGNCTFPEFRTTAMCSICEDITAQIDVTCDLSCNCTWTPPLVLTDQLYGPNNTASLSGAFEMNVATLLAEFVNDSISETELAITTTLIYRINATVHGEQTSIDNCSLPYGAVESTRCRLLPCIATFSSNISKGRTNEIVIDTAPLNQDPDPNYDNAAALMPCLINGTYYNSSEFTQRNATNTINVTTLNEHQETVQLWVPSDCYFAYSSSDNADIQNFLVPLLDGSSGGYATLNPWISQLYSTGNNISFSLIQSLWSGLAAAITSQIRQTPDVSGMDLVLGSAYSVETCIGVQWPWITYPAVLLVLAFGLLLATIFKSLRHPDLELWMSSPLALLFHGLQSTVRERYQHISDKKEMKVAAKELHVELGTEDDNFMLFEASEEEDRGPLSPEEPQDEETDSAHRTRL